MGIRKRDVLKAIMALGRPLYFYQKKRFSSFKDEKVGSSGSLYSDLFCMSTKIAFIQRNEITLSETAVAGPDQDE